MDRKFAHVGLKEASTYEFRVSAVNQIGQGKPSFCTKPITCKDEIGKLQWTTVLPLYYTETSLQL